MTGFDPVLTGLVSTFTAAAPAYITVNDGEPVDTTSTAGFLAVGWGSEEGASVTFTSEIGDYGNAVDWDTIAVFCLLSLQDGNLTLAQLRTKIDAAFVACIHALKADPTLGGASMMARVSSADYIHDARSEASLAQIRFTVSVQVG